MLQHSSRTHKQNDKVQAHHTLLLRAQKSPKRSEDSQQLHTKENIRNSRKAFFPNLHQMINIYNIHERVHSPFVDGSPIPIPPPQLQTYQQNMPQI